MAEDDPYMDPYAPQADALPRIVDPAAANAAAERAGYFASQHRAAMTGREKEIRDIQEKQQLNIGTMTKMLEDTAAQIKRTRAGQSSLPLIEMGAGMMSSPGHFGQQVGAGLRGLASGIRGEREADRETTLKLAELDMKKATIANMPLESRLAYMKALQTGDIAALARIEAMQIKAQAGGAGSAKMKEYELWKQTPGNEGKSFEEYIRLEAGLKDRGTALQREFDMAKKDSPDLKWEEFLSRKAAATASGHATGEDQGKTRANYANSDQSLKLLTRTIDQIVAHPGMENAVGKFWSEAPAMPGTPKADFQALYESLKGQVFTNAYNALRGAGAITEAEGLKATVSQLATAAKQSPEAFKATLRQYQEDLKQARIILRHRAGMPMETGDSNGAGAGSPSPPSQTGQSKTQPGQAKEGDEVVGPGGAVFIVKGGKLVPKP